MASKEERKDALDQVLAPLRAALRKYELDEDTIIREMSSMFLGESTRPADKLHIIEIIGKWAQWNAPEKFEVTEKKVVISGKPEDLDI